MNWTRKTDEGYAWWFCYLTWLRVVYEPNFHIAGRRHVISRGYGNKKHEEEPYIFTLRWLNLELWYCWVFSGRYQYYYVSQRCFEFSCFKFASERAIPLSISIQWFFHPLKRNNYPMKLYYCLPYSHQNLRPFKFRAFNFGAPSDFAHL